MKRYLEVDQNCVTRNKFISSDRWHSFQQNLRKPYIVWLLITGVLKFLKMLPFSSRSKFRRLWWCGPKFTTFSMEGSGREYFGKLILMVFECHACKRFCYSFVFLMFGKLIFAPICHILYFATLELKFLATSVMGG